MTNLDCTIETVIFNGNPQKWQASTIYNTGDFVVPTTWNGFIYEATTGGTTSGIEPNWKTTIGQTNSNGSVTWTCRSAFLDNPITLFSGKINNIQMTAATFSFDVERKIGGYSTVSPNATYDCSCQVKKFKDSRCGYAGAETWCDKTLTRCKVLNNQTRFYGFPTITKSMVVKS
jgi:hypothetical protein